MMSLFEIDFSFSSILFSSVRFWSRFETLKCELEDCLSMLNVNWISKSVCSVSIIEHVPCYLNVGNRIWLISGVDTKNKLTTNDLSNNRSTDFSKRSMFISRVRCFWCSKMKQFMFAVVILSYSLSYKQIVLAAAVAEFDQLLLAKSKKRKTAHAQNLIEMKNCFFLQKNVFLQHWICRFIWCKDRCSSEALQILLLSKSCSSEHHCWICIWIKINLFQSV